MPSKLKGTMVGVAPMMAGSAPAPAHGGSSGSGAPSAFDPPPPPADFGGGANVGGGYGAPPPGGNDPYGSQAVNPLGGTMVADQVSPFASGGGQPGAFPPPAGGGYGGPSPQDASIGGYGSPQVGGPGAYGSPPPGGGGNYGPPPGGGGGYGAPPQQDFASQVSQGFNQAADALNQGFNQVAGYGQQQGYGGQPQALAPAGGYGQQQGYGGQSQALAPAGGYQGGPMAQPGAHGPRGQMRNPMTVLILGVCTFGIYQMIWFIQIAGEMQAFLQRDEPNWLKIMGLSMVTCGLYGLYWQLTALGPLVQEVQQRAGVPNPQNHGFMYLIPYYNVILLQQELNRAWQGPA